MFTGIVDLLLAGFFVVMGFVLPPAKMVFFLVAAVFGIWGCWSIHKSLEGREKDPETVRDLEERISAIGRKEEERE
jgi:hypothetical protein